MRFVRIDRLAPGGAAVELHPRLTVVVGAPAELRRRLLQTVRAVVGDEVPECGGMIEVSGVRLALDRPTLDQLRIDPGIDPVLAFSPASAASRTPGSAAEQGPGAEHLMSSTVVVDRDRSTLRADLRQVTTARTRLGERMEEVRRGLDSFSRASLDVCRGQIEALEARRSALRAEREALREERARRRQQLVDQLVAQRSALAAVGDADPTPVREASEALVALLSRPTSPDPQAVRLAEELTVALEATLEATRRRGRIEDRLAEIDAELVEARAELAAVESAAAPPTHDPEVVRRLEAVRDEIFSKDDRAGLLGSARGKRRLSELRAEEAVLLDRLGLDTYSAYVMGIPIVRSDLERSDRLDAARRRVSDAEAAAGALHAELAAAGADPDLGHLEQLLELWGRAAEVLGEVAPAPTDPGRHDELETQVAAVVAQLREPRPASRGIQDPAVRRAVDELDAALRAASGTEQAGELDLVRDDPDALVELAQRWVDGAEARDFAARHLAGQVRELDEQLTAFDQQAEPDFDLVQLAQVEADLDAALDRLAEAEGRVHIHEEAMDRLADLRSEELVLRDRERELLAAIAAAESAPAAVAPGPEAELVGDGSAGDRPAIPAVATPAEAASSPRSAGGGSPGAEIDDHWALVARLATQRSVSFVGSVPLILDGLPTDARHRDRVLERAAAMSDLVQVLVLSDDRAIADLVDSAAVEGAVVRIA